MDDAWPYVSDTLIGGAGDASLSGGGLFDGPGGFASSAELVVVAADLSTACRSMRWSVRPS